MRENLDAWGVPAEPGPQKRLDAAVGVLRQALEPEDPAALWTIELPVIFARSGARWLAYTPNFANCLVSDGKAVMTESRGPAVNGQNRFHSYVRGELLGKLEPVFINAWMLHTGHGEVHCGSNCRRAPLRDDWWAAWPPPQP